MSIFFQKLIALFIVLNASSDDEGWFIIIGILIWFISLFIARWLISKHVLRMMNKASKKTTNENPKELIASEIKAKNKPVFEDLYIDSDRSLAINKRELFVKNAYLLFRKKYFFGLLAILIYIVIPFVLYKLSGKPVSDESSGVHIMFIVFYFLIINFNYFFYRKQFRAQDAHFGIRFEHPYVTLLRKIVNPTMEVYLTFVVVILISMFGFVELGLIASTNESNMVEGNTLFGIGLLLASLFHLISFFKIRKIAQKEPNRALLVLRVFGDKKQTELTFGKITNFWKHFGSWFTVADPSFIKRQYKIFTLKTLVTLVVLFITATLFGMLIDEYLIPIIKSLFPDTSARRTSEIAFIPGMIVAWIIYYQYLRFNISRSYAQDIEDIKKKLDKTLKRPRKLNLTFKSLPIFCYNNTWKLAVSEFIKNSRVILMDLRGFSDKRKGCEYEIDFLLDTFPINQILFLVDVSNDRSFVQKTILARWEFLREHSPNISLENPIARIYISDSHDKKDVQSILDLLIVSVDDSKIKLN